MTYEDAIDTLRGGLWHTTSTCRFESIRTNGAILADPPDQFRYPTTGGRENWPYVRKLGGVSLFDFEGFDIESYSRQYPGSSWAYFVPFRRDWGASVWIEIIRSRVSDKIIAAADLVARWKCEDALRHKIMPQIEAAYLGDIPCEAFDRVLIAKEHAKTFLPYTVAEGRSPNTKRPRHLPCGVTDRRDGH